MADAPFTADDELVQRARSGETAALAELLEFLGPRVRDRLEIQSLWRADIDADDVMQTTYLESFLRIGQLEATTTAGFVAWMTAIARNNLRDAIRQLQRGRRPDRRRQVTLEESCARLLDEIGCTSHTASRDAVAGEVVTQLRVALDRLPESYRLVVELYDLQGRDIDVVAGQLDRSPGAVYMLRARAHDRLAELLGPSSDLFPTRT